MAMGPRWPRNPCSRRTGCCHIDLIREGSKEILLCKSPHIQDALIDTESDSEENEPAGIGVSQIK